MKKLSLLLAVFCLIGGVVAAQDKIMLKSNSHGIYVEHVVEPREGLYAIGRLYNISPKDIAAFNNIDLNKGLNIGQQLLIPLNSQNFSQTTDKGVPVYYQVGEGEGLYRVSLNSNKVQMEKIRKWNHLANDNIAAGSSLVVGYLTGVDPAITAHTVTANSSTATNVPPATTNVPKKEVITESKKEESAVQPIATVKEEPQKETIKTAEKKDPVTVASGTSSQAGGSGFFKNVFDQQVKVSPVKKNETVTAGVFKTASGWQDGKYYMLIDKVEPGIIVMITNPSNGKSVYAKVLGEMSGIRQNNGLDIRMSNAAASVLDIREDDKFIVQIKY